MGNWKGPGLRPCESLLPRLLETVVFIQNTSQRILQENCSSLHDMHHLIQIFVQALSWWRHLGLLGAVPISLARQPASDVHVIANCIDGVQYSNGKNPSKQLEELAILDRIPC